MEKRDVSMAQGERERDGVLWVQLECQRLKGCLFTFLKDIIIKFSKVNRYIIIKDYSREGKCIRRWP